MLFLKPFQHTGAFHQKLYFGDKIQQKICIFKHVLLNYLLPRAKRRAVNIVDSGIKGYRQGCLLVFCLILVKGHKLGNACVFVVLEIKAQDLFYYISGAELLRVYRQHSGILWTKLGIQIHSDGYTFDFPDALGQFAQLFVKLTVIVAFGKLVYPVAKRAEGTAFQVVAYCV